MTQDALLKQAVLAELNWEPSLDAAHIGVTAENGVVSLLGHVATYGQKLAAETATRRVKGVKAVAEELEVHLPSDARRGDDDIAAQALRNLAADGAIPQDKITVKVEKGWVTLRGEVDWYYQKSAVEADIRFLHGVVGVFNHVSVKPRPDTGAISNAISEALNRSWLYDSTTVHVSANGGHIRLLGTVSTPYEREMVASIAWAAPGATAVENDLVIA